MPTLNVNEQEAIREIVTPERARFDERERPAAARTVPRGHGQHHAQDGAGHHTQVRARAVRSPAAARKGLI